MKHTEYKREPKVLVMSQPLNLYLLQIACHWIASLTLAAVALTAWSGCSRRYHDLPAYVPVPFKDYPNTSVGRFKSSYLAEQIDAYYRGTNPGPLGITTFVNLDDLYTTSTFGRMYAEQVMSELAMKGFDVVELRHSDALQFMADAGELALSRDISAVRRERNLGGVIVGTYVVSPIRVYINARLIDPTTSMILSAGSVEMEKTEEIAKLLKGGGISPTLERIPVRHLGISTYPMGLFPNYFFKQYEGEEWDASSWHTTGHKEKHAVEPRLETSPPRVEAKLPPAKSKKSENKN